jgi:hypothetical protein
MRASVDIVQAKDDLNTILILQPLHPEARCLRCADGCNITRIARNVKRFFNYFFEDEK